jgi:hypothetical protein
MKMPMMQFLSIEIPPDPAFSNSMEWGNRPGDESPNPGVADDRKVERTASKSDGDSGLKTPPSVSDFPKIPDPHAPGAVGEVGADNVHQYGLKGD